MVDIKSGMIGCWVACFAALFTFSLPGMPAWPGAQTKAMDKDAAAHVLRWMWMRETGRCEGVLADGEDDKVIMCWRQLQIACNSVVYTDAE